MGFTPVVDWDLWVRIHARYSLNRNNRQGQGVISAICILPYLYIYLASILPLQVQEVGGEHAPVHTLLVPRDAASHHHTLGTGLSRESREILKECLELTQAIVHFQALQFGRVQWGAGGRILPLLGNKEKSFLKLQYKSYSFLKYNCISCNIFNVSRRYPWTSFHIFIPVDYFFNAKYTIILS